MRLITEPTFTDPSEPWGEALRDIVNLVVNAGTSIVGRGPLVPEGGVLMAVVPHPEQQWVYSGWVGSRLSLPVSTSVARAVA